MAYYPRANGTVHFATTEDVDQLRIMRDELKRARLAGLSAVAFGEDRVEYKSDREMAAALAAIETDIAILERGRSPSFIRINPTKGA